MNFGVGLGTETRIVDTAKMKRPSFGRVRGGPSGRVVHDDRGNAVWQWEHHNEPGRNLRKSDLEIADTGNVVPEAAQVDASTTVAGYSPYDSGPVRKESQVRKPSHRELSTLIERNKKPGEETKR